MFYPAECLRRGGTFYLCWVADSWPLRFAAMTSRQLGSQDICKICDSLLHFTITESGRPVNRFSLRLSSQLMRGLVRVYERKVNIFLGDLCSLDAKVLKCCNKRYMTDEQKTEVRPRLKIVQLEQDGAQTVQVPEGEERVEEIIIQSDNRVRNIDDITLKEATAIELQLPTNDNFGEQYPGQALQVLIEGTVEQMLTADKSAAQYSGLELPPLDATNKSHEKTHLRVHDAVQMERISDQDVTFRKSAGPELPLEAEFERDIPQIPDIPIPDASVLHAEKEKTTDQPEIEQRDVVEKGVIEEFQLEELEDNQEPKKKRRRPKKMIIDKKTILSSSYMISRIDNNKLELRCETTFKDRIQTRTTVTPETYFERMAHAGPYIQDNISMELSSLFQGKIMQMLAAIKKTIPEAEVTHDKGQPEIAAMEIEQPVEIGQPVEIEQLVEIGQPVEIEQPVQIEQPVEIEQPMQIEQPVQVPTVSVQEHMDISDLPTQKIYEDLDQRHIESAPESTRETRKSKRTKKANIEETPKRSRLAIPSDKESLAMAKTPLLPERNQEDVSAPGPSTTQEQSLLTLLQDAGLADLCPPDNEQQTTQNGVPEGYRRAGTNGTSRNSETPLGSLDRTRVSLGDTESVTDSIKFKRRNWGTQGTLYKLVYRFDNGISPTTVKELVAMGPAMPGQGPVIAAYCFGSILKLISHGFIRVIKNPETLEIIDIQPGPKLCY